MHGAKCKVGAACTVGRRVQEMYILGGLILPVWGTVEKALSKQVYKLVANLARLYVKEHVHLTLQMSFVQVRASHRRLRVVWLETSSESQRIVGLHIPNPAVNAVISGMAFILYCDNVTR